MYTSIIQAIKYWADIMPDKYCIIDEKKALSYNDIINEVKKTASVLMALDVGEGDSVIVEGCQTADFFLMEFAIHARGGIFVPVEKKCPNEKVLRLAGQCKAKLFVSIKNRDILGINAFTYEKVEENRKSCAFDEIHLPEGNSVSEILFSTGTTGKEKGIVLSHKSDVAVAENIAFAVEMQNDNIEMIPSPLNHSHGLRSAYANFITGGTVVIFDNIMFLKKLFDMMDKYKVNAIDLVPSALSIILKMSNGKLAEYKDKLRYMEFGSAAMLDSDRDTIRSLLPNVPMYNFYGSTEAGRAAVYNFNKPDCKAKCIGKATHNTKIIIVDDDRKEIESGPDNSGLIACSGSMCMDEYYLDAFETNNTVQNGIIYSNDEAYVDKEGDIILLGRRGDVINIGGRKVSPEEIENVAKQMPGVVDCGCIAIEDNEMGQVPQLFIQMENPDEFEQAEVFLFLEQSELEKYKIPKKICQIAKVPRTFNGKIIRKELIKIKGVNDEY